MAIISAIGRKSLKVRLLIWAIYAGLTAGAVTMLYPFALMIAGSTKSAVDTPDPHIVPPYLVNRQALYQKYIEALFNESFESMRVAYGGDETSFQNLKEPASVNNKLADEWADFCTSVNLPFYTYMIGELHTPVSRGVAAYRLRRFKRRMIDRFKGDIERLNEEMQAEYVGWNSFYFRPEIFLLRRNKPAMRPLDEAFRQFKAEQPVGSRYYFSPDGYYRVIFLQTKYARDLERLNEACGTRYSLWRQVHLDPRLPDGPGRTQSERDDWLSFVRTILNVFWIRADTEAAPSYRAFLETKYRTIEALNRNYGTTCAGFDEMPLIVEPPPEGIALSDWSAFIEGWKDMETGEIHQLAPEHIYIHSVDIMFRDHMREKYGDINAFNKTMGADYATWLDVTLPQRDLHYRDFLDKIGWLRREFTVRNFITVIDYVVLHGRGILNTCLYCLLAILSALIINPIAAYALSRYKPPSQYKVLLFLMMTMAFPPMVTQIPVFLMLREFNLLNTFWALILPGLAHGYSIFLLKGFFDSLPQELYESASIDGASEFRIFWQITMSLSKPILAVIALNAFTQAYSNFMMALLICQDEKMWTLMPWLYQLQQRSGEGVVFASLLIAAVPTFFIFAFCQNVIMRGIVVPVEK